MSLPDVQNSTDSRGISINEVGITGVKVPISFPGKDGSQHHSVADIDMGVYLPADQKGTHMSRFQTILSDSELHLPQTGDYLKRITTELGSRKAFMRLEFPLFTSVCSPVSGLSGSLDYHCYYRAYYDARADSLCELIGVKAPVTTLCPCSKEIAVEGAHNQRAYVSALMMSLVFHDRVWFEDLADVALNSGSCPVYPILKRADEKWVTEKAYNNPKFVEDAARDAYISLGVKMPNRFKEAQWLLVFVSSEESIHHHNAFARIEVGNRNSLVDDFITRS